MLEPYAVKVARTVLRGGKPARAYLSQLDTLVVHTLNDGGYRLGASVTRSCLPELAPLLQHPAPRRATRLEGGGHGPPYGRPAAPVPRAVAGGHLGVLGWALPGHTWPKTKAKAG